MVIYGDSHAAMWFDAMQVLAKSAHWKLDYLGKGYCPVASLPYENPPGWGPVGGEYGACDRWRQFALRRIRRIRPALVVVTEELRSKPNGSAYTEAEWQQGFARTLAEIKRTGSAVDVLGNIPILPEDGPSCLSSDPTNVQTCSHAYPPYVKVTNRAERAAAAATGARYIDTTPWFCSTTCTALVGHYSVYYDRWHVGAGYAHFLLPVLGAALDVSPHGSRST